MPLVKWIGRREVHDLIISFKNKGYISYCIFSHNSQAHKVWSFSSPPQVLVDSKAQNKTSTYAGQRTTDNAIHTMSLQQGEVMVKGAGSGRDATLWATAKSGIRLRCIHDVTHMRLCCIMDIVLLKKTSVEKMKPLSRYFFITAHHILWIKLRIWWWFIALTTIPGG